MQILNTYCDAVVAYFKSCGVPVVYTTGFYDEIFGHCAYFSIDPSITNKRHEIHLFSCSVDGDDNICFMSANNLKRYAGTDVKTHVTDFAQFAKQHCEQESPVDRVDYSSSYHYQHIMNALPDMLRVGVKRIVYSSCAITTCLSDKITQCKKHFRPTIVGTITDYCVDYQRSIRMPIE